MSRIIYALTRNIGHTVQMSHHLGDLIRITVQPGITAVRSRRGLHTQQGSRSHLAARHAVDGVVDIDRHDILAAGSRMDRLGRTDGRQVAVALVREDQVPGVEPLDGRCNGQRTAVRRLDPVDIDVVVGENRAAYGRNASWKGRFFV